MLQSLLNATKKYPLASRFVMLIALPLLAIAWFAVAKLKEELPPTSMVLTHTLMGSSASIERDDHGVPHITAGTDVDAYFAVGYAHGQDRLWQLELQRRMVQGRLSEIFGKDSVQQDTWFRTLGLYEAARSAWPSLSKEAQASLTAYSAGVNAAIAERHGLPIEFQILNVKPQPWTEIDSLAWIKMFALDLGGNFRLEIMRFLVNQSLPSKQAETFFSDYPSAAPTTVADQKTSAETVSGMAALLNFQKDMEAKYGLGGRAVGSNAWVVAGKHTQSGAAFLANDPHLGLQIPSLWYALSVKGKTLNVSGMSLVGLPLVIFGHNEHIAWGGTSMMADTQDLYLEHPDGNDPNFYDLNGSKEPFTIRTEEIGIRADFPEQLHKKYLPITVHIRSTRHGPIISDQFHVFDAPVSLRWTALDAGDTSYEAFYRLGYSSDWPSFNAALHYLVAPALNMVYADRDGNIGYLGAGRVPIREHGDGSVPSPGWSNDYEWTGFIPPERMPQTFNPEAGYIVTANNKVVGVDYPYFISRDWASPARAERIEEMLTEKIRAKKPLSLGDMQEMQRDTIDVDARNMILALAGFVPRNDEQDRAWAYLKNWNGDASAGSPAAGIFYGWMRHVKNRLFAGTLRSAWKNTEQADYAQSIDERVGLDRLAQILQEPDSPWCHGGKASTSCQMLLADSLQDAIAEIYKLKGNRDMASWKWGEFQTTVYAHSPFSSIKPFDRFFEKRIANGGSENTVDVSGAEFTEKEGYLQHFGASFRQIVSLDRDRIDMRYMNSTGQSGDPMSAHYADMVEPFRDVKYYSLNFGDEPGTPSSSGRDMRFAAGTTTTGSERK